MLSRSLLTVLLAASAAAHAQSPSPSAPSAAGTPAAAASAAPTPLDGRKNQKVERIRHEDERVVIDELRYGGQTQSIKVQPKNGAPAYEVQPGGPRVWNVLSF